jgi:(p)ppGpp synthase/HD superfamily hydrolase
LLKTVERAAIIARRAHQGQKYGNRDYIDAHVSQVAAITARLGYSEMHVAAAWLHDVIEDTAVSLEDLEGEGIPLNVVEAVEALTQREGESYTAYLGRVTQNQIAIAVKYADLSANFGSTMLLSPYLSTTEFREWSQKYASAIAYLLPLIPHQFGG